LLCIEVQHIFISLPFSLRRHYQMPEYFYFTTALFELVQQFYHATEIGNVAKCGQRCSAIADKTIVSNKVNYRGTQS